MSRVGQVWDSSDEGLCLVIEELPHPNVDTVIVAKLLLLEHNSIGYLPTYIFTASEIVSHSSEPESLATWRRFA